MIVRIKKEAREKIDKMIQELEDMGMIIKEGLSGDAIDISAIGKRKEIMITADLNLSFHIPTNLWEVIN